MATPRQAMLDVLQQLLLDEFKEFKWHLEDLDIFEGLRPITKAALETAERTKTVDLLIQKYSIHAEKVFLIALNKVQRNDLMKEFENTMKVFEFFFIFNYAILYDFYIQQAGLRQGQNPQMG